MKKLHIISSRNGDIRPRCATDEEILAIAEGRVEHAGHLLASVSVGDDGEIVATPLGQKEIAAAAQAASARKAQAGLDALSTIAKIIAALDLSLEMQARAASMPRVDGLRWNTILTLWPDSNPAAEEALRGWATAHEFAVHESWSHYDDGTSIRAITVTRGYDEVARAQWHSVKTDDSPGAKADKEQQEAKRIVREEREAAAAAVLS